MYIFIVLTVVYCYIVTQRYITVFASYIVKCDEITALYREEVAACPINTTAMSHRLADCIGTVVGELIITNCSSSVNQQPVPAIS